MGLVAHPLRQASRQTGQPFVTADHILPPGKTLPLVPPAGWMPVAEPQTVKGGERDGMRLIYVRGPDGVTIELIQERKRQT